MSKVIDTWHRDHVNFVHLLKLLEAEIEHYLVGETSDYVLMHDILYYMTHYPDIFHHPKEDFVFMRIKELDPAAQEVVDELMLQHDVLRDSGARLHGQLEGIMNGAMMKRGSIEEPARTYIDYFRKHMRKEEMEAFPLALKLLSREDWAEIEKKAPFNEDPLFGGGLSGKQYERLRRQLGRKTEVAEEVA